MFENASDGRQDKDFTTEDRLFAIAYWRRRVFSATVDQFLGFMQYAYRSVCLLPVLADSVVVIDEVHSFDRSLFSSLKRFLREFALPVLCMTASLPTRRQRDLVECGLRVFPEDVGEFADLQGVAAMRRYKFHVLDGAESARELARRARSNGKRILWVVNTVDRCQQLARELGAECYHSRFTLDDRKERHQAIIGAFKPNKGAVLAVTTQVCEMSLDLDAQVLIMEAAPLTAMIQRMGRCNRHARTEGDPGEVYVYRPESERPYEAEDWKGTEGFLAALDGQNASQVRLQELLEKFGPDEAEVDRYAAFVESGPWAVSREASLRDDHGSQAVQAILDSEVERYLGLREENLPTDGLFLPSPWYLTQRDDRLGNYPVVAPATNYSRTLGLLNCPVEAQP
jgi:CRISPR-associated endonuclease/helicase Cas3